MVNDVFPAGWRQPLRPYLLLFLRLIVNRYTLFILFFVGYSELFVELGGIVDGRLFLEQHWEVAFLLYLYWYLNAWLKPSRWQPWIAAAIPVLCYLGPDISLLLLGRVFRLGDLSEVPELLRVMSWKYLLLTALVLGISLVVLAVNLTSRRRWALSLGALPLVALIVAVEWFPQVYVDAFLKHGREIVNWSDKEPVVNNGRLMMLTYREAERRLAHQKTNLFYDRESYTREARSKAAWLQEKGRLRNVHLIVMESFFDPTLFKDAKFTRDPVHPSYKKMFGEQIGFSISPVFGGRTSQAEFEALCGVPAYEAMGGVEFNSFSGTQAYCLPGVLKEAGYRTAVSNSFDPTFFNAVSAYRGIGFGELYFPREFTPNSPTYITAGDVQEEHYMFDGDLFAQNRSFVRDYVQKGNQPPLLNYMLTMYGHLPYLLHKEKRPEIFKLVSRFYDGHLERAANQFYYRTEAVAEHVRELREIDPHSLIIIVSDHLPPLSGQSTYQKLRYLDNQENGIYLNRIIIVEDGQIKKYSTIHHYDIPKLILNYLTAGAFCDEYLCSFSQQAPPQQTAGQPEPDYHEQYMRLMAHAIK